MEGATLSDASLTNSYFSSSFIGVNGFGSPADSKYSMMQVKQKKLSEKAFVFVVPLQQLNTLEYGYTKKHPFLLC